MLAPLLMYGVPAALGGLAAYKQSGGDVGAGLLGAGLGAALPVGARMAGTALGGTALGANLLSKGSGLLGKGASALQGAALKGGMGPLAPIAVPALTAAGLGTAAAYGASALAPGLAGGIASGIAAPLKGGARNVAGAGATAAGVAGVPGFGSAPSQDPIQYAASAVPSYLDPQFGAGSPYGNYADAANPIGYAAAQRLMSEKEMDTQLRNATLQGNLIAKFSEEAKKAELARQLYANTVRTNLNTQQNLLLGGVNTARQMGVNAASQIGGALTSQYQYG